MKSLSLHNIKAFVDTGDIDIAPITIFVGQNSCGKSTFIRFPQVLSQTFNNGPTNPILLYAENQPDVIDFGFFKDVVHTGAKEFGVSLEYNIPPHKTRRFGNGVMDLYRTVSQEEYITAKIHITYTHPIKNSPKIYATNIKMYIEGALFSEFDKIGDSRKYIFHQYKTYEKKMMVDVDYSYTITASSIRNFMPEFDFDDVWQSLCEQSGIVESEEQRDYIEKLSPSSHTEQILRDLLDYIQKSNSENESEADNTEFEKTDIACPEEFKGILKKYNAFGISASLYTKIFECMRTEFMNLHYIGPFRSNPHRAYRRDETDREDVGINGDYTSSLLINDYQSNGKLISIVSGWLQKALKYTLDITEIGEGSGYFQIAIGNKTGQSCNLMDVGYGISQILPIVTQMAKATYESEYRAEKKKSSNGKRPPVAFPDIFVVEQPELHLHPNAQAELASLFSMVVQGELNQNRKILIETHSEHLIRKIQCLIADTNSPYHLSKDQVKIYYVHSCSNPDAEHGSWIEEMEIDEYGQFLKEWPHGFFDKAYNLTNELMTMVSKRKYAEKVNRS